MAWLTSCDSSNLITTQQDSWAEQMAYITGSGGVGGIAELKFAKRIHTLTVIEYVGVDKSTAETYVENNPAESSYDEETHIITIVKSCRAVRDGDGGAYKVVKETETISDWV